MPRNSSGVYTLPGGNPVVTGTVIESVWANTTLADLANEVTNSLDRQGRGSMIGQFKITDGTEAAPGLVFGAEPTTGMWRAGAGRIAFSALATQIFEINDDGLQIIPGTAAAPGLSFLGDPDTGIFQVAADQFGIATNGVRRIAVLNGLTQFGDSGYNYAVTLDGSNAGASGGAAFHVTNNNVAVAALGNRSAIIGGAYDATPTLWALPSLDLFVNGAVRAAIANTGQFGVFAADDDSLVVRNTVVTSGDAVGDTSINIGDLNSWVPSIVRRKRATNIASLILQAEFGFSTPKKIAEFDQEWVKFWTSDLQRYNLDDAGHHSMYSPNAGGTTATLTLWAFESSNKIISGINDVVDTEQFYVRMNLQHSEIGNPRAGANLNLNNDIGTRFSVEGGAAGRLIAYGVITTAIPAESVRIVSSTGYINWWNDANTVRTGYLQFNAGGIAIMHPDGGTELRLLKPSGAIGLQIHATGEYLAGRVDFDLNVGVGYNTTDAFVDGGGQTVPNYGFSWGTNTLAGGAGVGPTTAVSGYGGILMYSGGSLHAKIYGGQFYIPIYANFGAPIYGAVLAAYNSTWQSFTAPTIGTEYQNNQARPVAIYIAGVVTGNGSAINAWVSNTSGSGFVCCARHQSTETGTFPCTVGPFIVPPYQYWKLTVDGTFNSITIASVLT